MPPLRRSAHNVHLVRSIKDPDYPWLAVLPASAIIGFWYWCTDQYIVQRVLAGKNQQESRRGSILAGFFKLTPVFIFLVPGMIAFALTQTPGVGFSTSGDAAYTSLVAQILPHGLRGMVACGMIVALMASLGSKFNASATLFTMDFYREWYPNASGKTEVFVGRVATAVIVFVGICWVLVIKSLTPIFTTICRTCRATFRPPSPCCSSGRVSGNAPPPRRRCGPSWWAWSAVLPSLAADLVMRNDSDAVAKLKVISITADHHPSSI